MNLQRPGSLVNICWSGFLKFCLYLLFQLLQIMKSVWDLWMLQKGLGKNGDSLKNDTPELDYPIFRISFLILEGRASLHFHLMNVQVSPSSIIRQEIVWQVALPLSAPWLVAVFSGSSLSGTYQLHLHSAYVPVQYSMWWTPLYVRPPHYVQGKE